MAIIVIKVIHMKGQTKQKKVGAFKKLAKRLFYEDDYVMIAG